METNLIENVQGLILTYGTGFGVFLVFLVLAELYLRWRENKGAFGGEIRTNASLVLLGPVAEGIFLNALLFGGLFLVYQVTPLRIPVELWTLPIYFLVGEFGYYWFHRLGHEVRLLWADHSIHHSAEVYDFTVNLRHTPFSTLYRFVTWSPLVALGFHPLVLVAFAMTGPAFQTICHTERIGRLSPWFEWLFVTPCNHAVHHSSNELYLDKNYGGLLNIWDHLFGTYQRLEDHTPPVYGLTSPVGSNNVARVVSHEFVRLFRDFRGAPGFRQKAHVLFGRPGKTFEAKPADSFKTAAPLAEGQ